MSASKETSERPDEPTAAAENAYFEEATGLRDRYDSHIMPADYKYRVGKISCYFVWYLKY